MRRKVPLSSVLASRMTVNFGEDARPRAVDAIGDNGLIRRQIKTPATGTSDTLNLTNQTDREPVVNRMIDRIQMDVPL